MAVDSEEKAEDPKNKLDRNSSNDYEVVKREDPSKKQWMLEKVAGLFS